MNKEDKELLKMIRDESDLRKCCSIMSAFGDRILDRMIKVCVPARNLVFDCYAQEFPKRWRIRWKENYQTAWNVFEFRMGRMKK
jgi:hypothetical protein